MEHLLLILLLIPLAGALITALAGSAARNVAFGFSLLSLLGAGVMVSTFVPNAVFQFVFNYPWIPALGIHLHAGVDGIGMVMILLTNVLVPLIMLSAFRRQYVHAHAFYALVLFMQFGLLLVFTAMDAFLFYIGWEAALIPIYFICAMWGGKDRIKVNMKFFVYTIAGSLFMLLGIIFLYLHNPADNFNLNEFYAADLLPAQQNWVFLSFLIAFAVKMPIFPFHTWQPNTYTEAPAQGTMLLAGIMLKMGVYGILRWILPIAPAAVMEWGSTVIILSVIGIVYASLIAFTRNNVKRLAAYSSIGHVGLISAGIFAASMLGIQGVAGMQGAMLQMVSHGINIVGLFFVLDIIYQRTGTLSLKELGGIAKVAPKFAIVFLIIVLGAVALPGTSGFPGEFLLLLGLFEYNTWIAAIAGLTVIFSAVYMLRMYQKSMLGEINEVTSVFEDIKGSEKIVLYTICFLIIGIGVYPKPLLHLSEASVQRILELMLHKLQS